MLGSQQEKSGLGLSDRVAPRVLRTTFAVGQAVGGYQLLEQLNSSTAGAYESYKVHNRVADRFEVMRIFPSELARDAYQKDRFLREVRVHARLSHPNIASLYNGAEIDGQLVVTTEYVQGITLAQRLKAGPPSLKEGIGYVRQALSALDHAHSFGIVHRGIAPSNMIVGSEGTLKLAGYGFAKGPTDVQLTQMGTLIGSPEYMAPEQVIESRTLDARTDIYSLGAVFYELVTGEPPFVSKSQFQLRRAHVDTIPRPPSEVCPDVPPELDLIILTALKKAPSQRFQSAKEFQDALSLCALLHQLAEALS